MDKVTNLKFSIIIPVYNRPDEVEELLDSLKKQTNKDFEVIIVEDGSEIKSDNVIKKYDDLLDIRYFFKSNSGPGQSRNYGMERAKGNYFIILDSDCVLPPNYFEIVKNSIENDYVDAFGGPDKAHKNFTKIQKAINYSMTSFLTTGGIRGGSEKVDKFYPRSFNMGLSKDVFEKTKGFSKMRFGEDIDMSLRILKNGFKTKLINEAYVYHKRRTNLRQFFKQVYNSGIARINLHKKHPGSLKIVHSAPTAFILGVVLLLVLSFTLSWIFLIPVFLHILILIIDSSIKNKNLIIGMLSVITSYMQIFSYGLGFLAAFWKQIVLRKAEFSAFEKNFYK